MPTDIATLGIKIEAKDIKKAVAELDRLEKQSKDTETSTGKLKNSFIGLRSALAGLGLGLLTKQLLDQINTYTALSNKLKLVTTDSQNLKAVQSALFDVAQDTRASLEGTIDLYSRLARSTKDLNLSQEELADVTETINQAIAVSGATSQEASAALFQLGQGLSAGALRGEELNSVLEQTPRLAQAIADGLGVSIAQLRQMGAQGELNAERVITAIQNQASVINSEFGQTEKTISQALQQIENLALQTFGSLDSTQLVNSLDEFRQIISDPSIVSGLQSIASVMVDIVNLGVQAAAGWGMIFELFTSERTELEKLNDELRIQEDILSKIPEVAPAYKAVSESIEDLKNRIAELNAITPGSLTAPDDETGTSNADQLQSQLDIEAQLRLDHQTRLNESLALLEQQQVDESIARQLDQMDIEAALAQDRMDLARLEAEAKRQVWKDFFGNLSVLMTAESKRLFNIGKVAAIASAIINTSEAVTKTMASVPYPFNIPLAAAQAAAGAVQIQNIRNQQHGGGGGSVPTPGGGPGSNVPELPDYASPQTTTNEPQTQYVFVGNVMTEEFFDTQIAPLIEDRVNNYDYSFIDEYSSNGLDLRGT